MIYIITKARKHLACMLPGLFYFSQQDRWHLFIRPTLHHHILVIALLLLRLAFEQGEILLAETVAEVDLKYP